jgi:hypothetical protein
MFGIWNWIWGEHSWVVIWALVAIAVAALCTLGSCYEEKCKLSK